MPGLTGMMGVLCYERMAIQSTPIDSHFKMANITAERHVDAQNCFGLN